MTGTAPHLVNTQAKGLLLSLLNQILAEYCLVVLISDAVSERDQTR